MKQHDLANQCTVVIEINALIPSGTNVFPRKIYLFPFFRVCLAAKLVSQFLIRLL